MKCSGVKSCEISFPDMRRDIQEIFRVTPHEKQVMMFSATLSKEVRPICKKFMQDVIIRPTKEDCCRCRVSVWWPEDVGLITEVSAAERYSLAPCWHFGGVALPLSPLCLSDSIEVNWAAT